MKIRKFDWDEGNFTKNLRKHGITIQEIEEIFANQPTILPDKKHSNDESRYVAIGKTKNEDLLTVIFTFRIKFFQLSIRPISARRSNKKERIIYEEASTKI